MFWISVECQGTKDISRSTNTNGSGNLIALALVSHLTAEGCWDSRNHQNRNKRRGPSWQYRKGRHLEYHLRRQQGVIDRETSHTTLNLNLPSTQTTKGREHADGTEGHETENGDLSPWRVVCKSAKVPRQPVRVDGKSGQSGEINTYIGVHRS
jgi:hypothetical protein